MKGVALALAVLTLTAVIAAAILLPRDGGGPVAASPMPSVTASSSLAPSASLSPGPAPSPSATAGSARYVNTAIGYSIVLPATWRRTPCLSIVRDPRSPDVIGSDGFTSTPPEEETYGGIGGLPGTVVVSAERDPRGLTPEDWARARLGAQDRHLSPATVDGRAGVRLTRDDGTDTLVVRVDGAMYVITLSWRDPADPRLPTMRAIVASLAFVARTPPPSPSPRPARTAEQVADGLADGFARKDVAQLVSLMDDCLMSAGENGGASSLSRERFTRMLGDLFAGGTTVTVRARPLEPAPGYFEPAVAVATTWTDAGQAPARVDLIIGTDGAFSSWRGMIRRLRAP